MSNGGRKDFQYVDLHIIILLFYTLRKLKPKLMIIRDITNVISSMEYPK